MSPGPQQGAVRNSNTNSNSPTRPLAHSPSSCRSAESKFVAINKAYTSLTKSHGRSGRAATAGAFYRQAKPKASNGILAGVLVGPLVMLGFYMSKSRGLELAEASDAMKSRPRGFWYPPHNEFLREDLRPREGPTMVKIRVSAVYRSQK